MIGQTISHYKILEKLGEGGMGVVYRALDTSLDRPVALKLLPPRAVVTDDDRARFANEARAAAKLSHPNIATVHEFGEAEGHTFLAMEFVEGKSLRKKAQEGPLSVTETLCIAADAASGLVAAHERGIVHRDVKSENIMVTTDGSVKIMDFGLAQVRGQSWLWKSGETVGTVSYMSPEQARGEHLDERTDIWSLGVVIYEMLTTKLPFPGDYESAVLYLIIHEQPQPIKSHRDDVPAKLQEIVSKCLEKDRDRRYAKASELLSDVKALQKQLEKGLEEAKEKPVEAKRFETERRQVTILFAIIAGYESFADAVDPEILSTSLNDCFNGLLSIIHKYEGMTDRLVGEKVMAVFGAPVAHENDPERAVRCALEMRSYMERFSSIGALQLPGPFGLRIGIHSGMVIAGSVGAQKTAGYSVIGDTVNLAAGIVELAPAGSVFLSSDSYRLVRDIVQVDDQMSSKIKGKTQPEKIYPLRALKAGVEAGRRAIGGGAFVGRKKELDAIDASVDSVRRKNEVRLFVRGEAGVGKTRLKDEMTKSAQKVGMVVCEGRCSSFETNTPYYLWNTFLKSLLRVGTETAESEVRLRLHDTLQILALEAEEPYLATLLSLRYEEILMEVDAERRRKIFEATSKLLLAFASRRPSLFVFEDLHWIDRFSQELLEFIFAQEKLAPALFCCLFRAEYTQAKQMMGRGDLLDLDRLPDDEAKELMRSRLGAEAVPDVLAQLVDKRAEGNPFFIEEIVKTLLDRRVVAVKRGKVEILSANLEAGVPETLQGVILARIDQLEGRIREVLLDASVIGREFSRLVLEHVVEKKIDVPSGLDALEALELILEKEAAQEFQYLFKHYLIQEVAYNTILAQKRKKLHGLIAQAIERLYADKLKEFYELLAFHYEKAEDWQKAAEYLSRAGRKVGEIFTKEESNAFTERKEAAIQRLFQSAGERRIGWTILAALTAVVSFVLAVLTILPTLVVWVGLLIMLTHVYFVLDLTTIAVVGYSVFLMPWVSAAMLFFGVAPALRGRPKMIELLEDRVTLHFRRGKVHTLHFYEIRSIRFFDYEQKSQRPLKYKLLDPFYRITDYSRFGVSMWFKEVALGILPPFFFSAGSKKGEIIVERKKGWERMRLLMPWLNTPKKSRAIILNPSDPKEYYQQFTVAYAKWKKLQAVEST